MEAVEAEGRKSPPLSLKVANSKQNENRWLARSTFSISCNISSATITYRFLAPLSYVGYRKGSRIGWIHQRVLTPQGKSHLDLPWAKKSPCGSPRGQLVPASNKSKKHSFLQSTHLLRFSGKKTLLAELMYRYEISCPFNLRSPAVPVSSKASSTSFIKTKALRISEVNRELSVPRVYREKSFTRRLNAPIFGSLFVDKESRFANAYSFTLNQGLTRGRGKQAKLAPDRRGKSVVTEVDYRTGVGENIVKD